MWSVPVLPGLDLALTPELRFILDLGVALALALVFGVLATRFGQPPIVGYLAAGVVIGPFTPGFVGDQEQIGQLAELGVVLLLFALGVEFSLHELRRVWRIAVPGAIAQIVITAVAGAAVVILLGMSPVEGAVIGSAIAISSTLVVLKILVERGEMDSLHGRAAIGWMVVQDLVTIILIALLEPLAGGGSAAPVLFALVRAAAFMALAYIVGTRLLPWLFRTVSRLGSPELFLLSVFATALLAAFLSSAVFGLSLALGAFVAGLIVSESDLSHQAAGEIIPFRDLFAVLFFVSVGMLLDPAALVDDWPALLALLAVAVGVKAAASAGLGRMLGLPLRSALLLGATIAQVGEFSFLLAEQALHVELIDARGYNLILATAILSIVLTPSLVRGASSLAVRIEHRVAAVDPPIPGQAPTTRGSSGLPTRIGSAPSWSSAAAAWAASWCGPCGHAGSGASWWTATSASWMSSPAWGRRRCTATRPAGRSWRAPGWLGRVSWWSRSPTRCRRSSPWSGRARSTRSSRWWPGRGDGPRSARCAAWAWRGSRTRRWRPPSSSHGRRSRAWASPDRSRRRSRRASGGERTATPPMQGWRRRDSDEPTGRSG